MYNILIMTPVGRTEKGDQTFFFPSRWSASTGKYKSQSFYPYELAYLSSYLKKNTEHNIRMIDANYYGVDSEEYLDILKKIDPDVLIIEMDYIIANKQIDIIKKAREQGLKFKLILCGPYPSTYPEVALKNGADFVAIGEFEQSILNLINGDFSGEIKGIYPNMEPELVDINKLPMPEDEDIKRINYSRHYGSNYREIEMFPTRGCPHMCNFCVASNIYYKKPNFRTRNVQNVIDEIKYLTKKYSNIEGFFFNEESHTSNREYSMELANRIIKENLDYLKFNCMTNYASLDEELLLKLKQAGYYKVRIGIESFDIENTKNILKTGVKSNNSKLIEILKVCKEIDIKVYGTISIGTLGSTFEKDLQTIENLKHLHEEGLIQEFQVSINTPMPGTSFYEYCQKKGLIDESCGNFDGNDVPMISYPEYSREEIRKVFDYANSFSKILITKNIRNGINYSSYDREWCKEVYATTNRKVGTGIL